MRDVKEILDLSKNDVEGIPSTYNMLETYCYLGLRQIVVMFQMGQVDKEQANIAKDIIVNDYEKKKLEYEKFERYQEAMYKSKYSIEELKKELRKITPIEVENKNREVLNSALKVVEKLTEEVIEF